MEYFCLCEQFVDIGKHESPIPWENWFKVDIHESTYFKQTTPKDTFKCHVPLTGTENPVNFK